MIHSTKNRLSPVTVFAQTQGIRNRVTVTTVTSADDAYADLLSRGLRLSITADSGLAVKPARLVDGDAADLIRTHRAGLIAILARNDPDPIRRGLLTGELAGWHIEGGIETEGLADWHADVLGIPHYEPKG